MFDPSADAEETDRTAIIMMLTYVEAECRRLGDGEAARHAALAAALVTGQAAAPSVDRRLPHGPAIVAPLN